MGHKQPPTPIQTDNAMADAVIKGKIQPKRTKAMDMRFHWLCNRPSHHVNIRKEFLTLTPAVVIEMLSIRKQVAARAKAEGVMILLLTLTVLLSYLYHARQTITASHFSLARSANNNSSVVLIPHKIAQRNDDYSTTMVLPELL